MAPNVTIHFFPDNDINGTPLLEITDEDEYFQGLKLNPDLWSLGGWELQLARNINFALFSSGAVQPEVFVRFLVHAWSDTKYFYGGVLQKRQQDVIDRDEAGAETFVFGGPGPKQYMDRYRLGTIQLTGSGWNLDLENGVWRFNETATSGRVLNRLVAEDAAAANPALPDLTSTFDQTDDSNGNPWTDTIADADGSFELPIGNSLLQTIWDLEDLADLYTTVELGTVSSPLYELNAYETFGDDNSGTSFGPSVCLLREGDNIANESLTVTGVAMKKPTHVIIEGKDGAWATKRRPSWSSGDYIKWEKIEYPRSNSQVILEKAGLRWLQRQTNAFDQITVEIVPGAAPSDGFYFPKPDGLLWVGNTITLDTVADGSTHSPLDYNNSPQLVTGLEIVLGPAGDDSTADKEAKSWDVKVKLNGERGGNSSHPDQRSASTGGGSCKCIKLCRSAFTTAEAGAYVTTHTGTAGTGGSINVPWPATDNNDLALLYFYAEDDRIVSTPSGWTLIDRYYSATADATTALFAKICDGTESGNQLVNGTGWGIGQSKAGKIFVFEGVDISGVSVPVYTEGNGTSVTAPTVDGNDLLAIAFTGVTESQTQVAFTGETGGDWVEINDDNFVNSAVETCSATITGSSISGGSKTLSTTSEWIVTGITLGVSDAVNGQADLVGTSGDASRCDHAHHVLRLDDPIATDDEESGYPPTTLWTVVDDLDNPTEVISTWLSIDGSDDAAVWVSFGNSGTMEHGDLTGLTDDDHPQYLRTTLGGRDVIEAHAAAGTTETLSLVNGNVHDVTLTADCTLTLAGATNGVGCTMAVLLRQGAGAPWDVTWPASVEWVGGSAPTLETAVDAWNWITLITLDGGTVWFAEGLGTGSGGGGGGGTDDGGQGHTALFPTSTITLTKDAGNPTLNFNAIPETITKVGDTYWAAYQTSAQDEVNLASATDRDGPWTAYASNPIFSFSDVSWAAAGADGIYAPEIYEHDGIFYLSYGIYDVDDGSDAAIGIATATSITGPYTDSGSARLSPGTSGLWDSLRVGEPSLLFQDGTWYMMYMGEDTDFAFGASEKVGIATATDPLGTWTKAAANPVINWTVGQWDDELTADPYIFFENGYFWCWYTGGTPTPWKAGLAYSLSPTTSWTKHANNPLLVPGAGGQWDDEGSWRGSVYVEAGLLSGVYGGIPTAGSISGVKGGNFRLTVTAPSGSEPTADAHIADTTDAHDASAVSILDTGGYFTGTDVEAALQELGADVSSISGHYEVIVSGTAPPVAVTNIAEDDWLYGFVPD